MTQKLFYTEKRGGGWNGQYKIQYFKVRWSNWNCNIVVEKWSRSINTHDKNPINP